MYKLETKLIKNKDVVGYVISDRSGKKYILKPQDILDISRNIENIYTRQGTVVVKDKNTVEIKDLSKYVIVNNKISFKSTTSKGDQLKWVKGDKWIKADTHGYEGLAEYIACKFIECTNVKSVKYKMTRIIDSDNFNEYKGCVSRTMYGDGEEFIPFAAFMPDTEYTKWKKLSSYDKIIYYIEGLKKKCNCDVTRYITETLYIDQLICNEDRHLNNLGLIRGKDGLYRPANIFDNGLSLLARDDYWGNLPTEVALRKVKYMPFGNNQIKALQQINPNYRVGVNLEKWYSKREELYGIEEYDQNTINKCIKIISRQLRLGSGVLWIETKKI